jgi:surfeit locus 1 family protein
MSPTSRRILILLLLLGGAVCARLGFWQLGRLRERRAANRIALEARGAPVVHLPGGDGSAGGLANRRVEAVGRYDLGNEIVVRGEAMGGVPGVNVVTPLRLDGSDTALLVNRGFVPAPDAMTVETEPLAEEGERTVTGIALPMTAGGGRPIERNGRTTWGRLDPAALEELLPYPIYPVYLRQAPDPALPRTPHRLPAPSLDDGPHLNYAIQWFLFAAMSVVFAVLVVAREGRFMTRGESRPAPGSSG